MEHFYLAGSLHCVPLSTFCTVGYYASLCLDLAVLPNTHDGCNFVLCSAVNLFAHLFLQKKHNFKKHCLQMTIAVSFTEETKLRRTVTEAATRLTAFAEAIQHKTPGETRSQFIISIPAFQSSLLYCSNIHR